jgi:hypothetical protein
MSNVGVLPEWRTRDGILVLAAYRENNPARSELERHSLHREERLPCRRSLTKFDSGHAIIADHAAPNRVVEIEDQTLPGKPSSRRYS